MDQLFVEDRFYAGLSSYELLLIAFIILVDQPEATMWALITLFFNYILAWVGYGCWIKYKDVGVNRV